MAAEWLGGDVKTSSQFPLVVCVAMDGDLLNLIRRYCSTLPCRTHTTESPAEALAMVSSSRVSLVLADQRLKTMSGTQLLKEVAQRSPTTARVLLASFPENHDILQSEEERIHGIIDKPWDGPSLQRTILAILRWQEERVRTHADTVALPLTRLSGSKSPSDRTATGRGERRPTSGRRRSEGKKS